MLQSLSIIMYGVGYLRDFIVQFLKFISIDADYIEFVTLPGFQNALKKSTKKYKVIYLRHENKLQQVA